MTQPEFDPVQVVGPQRTSQQLATSICFSVLTTIVSWGTKQTQQTKQTQILLRTSVHTHPCHTALRRGPLSVNTGALNKN